MTPSLLKGPPIAWPIAPTAPSGLTYFPRTLVPYQLENGIFQMGRGERDVKHTVLPNCTCRREHTGVVLGNGVCGFVGAEFIGCRGGAVGHAG